MGPSWTVTRNGLRYWERNKKKVKSSGVVKDKLSPAFALFAGLLKAALLPHRDGNLLLISLHWAIQLKQRQRAYKREGIVPARLQQASVCRVNRSKCSSVCTINGWLASVLALRHSSQKTLLSIPGLIKIYTSWWQATYFVLCLVQYLLPQITERNNPKWLKQWGKLCCPA